MVKYCILPQNMKEKYPMYVVFERMSHYSNVFDSDGNYGLDIDQDQNPFIAYHFLGHHGIHFCVQFVSRLATITTESFLKIPPTGVECRVNL